MRATFSADGTGSMWSIAAGSSRRTTARHSAGSEPGSRWSRGDRDGRPGRCRDPPQDRRLIRARPARDRGDPRRGPGWHAHRHRGRTNDASPDGTLLATADAEGRMRLLNLETLEWIGSDAGADTLADAGGGSPSPQTAASSPRCSSTGSGSGTGTLATTRAASRSQRSRRAPPSATAPTAQVSSSPPGTAHRTADTLTYTWADRACTIAGRNLTQAEWTKFFPSRPYTPPAPSGHRQARPPPTARGPTCRHKQPTEPLPSTGGQGKGTSPSGVVPGRRPEPLGCGRAVLTRW